MFSKFRHYYNLVMGILFTVLMIIGIIQRVFPVAILSALFGALSWLKYFYPLKKNHQGQEQS